MPGGKYDGWERQVIEDLRDQERRDRALQHVQDTRELSANNFEDLVQKTSKFMRTSGLTDDELYMALIAQLGKSSGDGINLGAALAAEAVVTEARRRHG